MKIKIGQQKFELTRFKNEKDLENAVINLAEDIFGKKSIYINLKNKIKNKTISFANIPDGYLLDFRSKIKLWIVENELSTHDSFKHIGIQLLKFATQFSEGSFTVKESLIEFIDNNKEVKEKFNLIANQE